jgi:hypothetical protein
MAIDKIIPRFLVSDKDERLLEEGAMTDALNVSISTSGDGTEGIIKNIKGTKAVNSINQSNAINTSSDHKCIGGITKTIILFNTVRALTIIESSQKAAG